MKEWQDFSENEPTETGWYATHYCWDPMEGSFVGSDKYNAETKEWICDYPMLKICGPFDSESDADDFAEKNDISW